MEKTTLESSLYKNQIFTENLKENFDSLWDEIKVIVKRFGPLDPLSFSSFESYDELINLYSKVAFVALARLAYFGHIDSEFYKLAPVTASEVEKILAPFFERSFLTKNSDDLKKFFCNDDLIWLSIKKIQ